MVTENGGAQVNILIEDKDSEQRCPFARISKNMVQLCVKVHLLGFRLPTIWKISISQTECLPECHEMGRLWPNS